MFIRTYILYKRILVIKCFAYLILTSNNMFIYEEIGLASQSSVWNNLFLLLCYLNCFELI